MSSKKFDEFTISPEMKQEILKLYIEPNYKDTVKESIDLIKYFRRFGIIFESMSKLLVGMGSVLSFSSGIYKNRTLSFVSGTVSVVSLVFLQYASFSLKESKKHTIDLNNILKKLHIQQVPEKMSETLREGEHNNGLSGTCYSTPKSSNNDYNIREIYLDKQEMFGLNNHFRDVFQTVLAVENFKKYNYRNQ